MRSQKTNPYGLKLNALGLYGLLGDFGPKAPLDSLNLIQDLDIDKFLELLNREEPLREEFPSQKQGDIPRLKHTPSAQEILKGWVDEWLDSGKNKQGVDDPRDRNFKMSERVAAAVYEYSKQGKILLLTNSNSLAPWLARFDREPSTPLRALIGPRPEDYAKEQLVFFLLSNIRFKLAKCRKEHCGTYFLLNHWNRRYKGGTLCDSCKRTRSEASAMKATADSRSTAAAELHKFVARKFAKQIRSAPGWQKQKELKGRIAAYLNAKIERSESLRAVYKRGITGKWVARAENWNEIDTILKGGK